METIHSYPKIYNVGHAALDNFFDSYCYIEEKVDGSQFSFGVIDGVLRCRSHGAEVHVDAPEKMFTEAVETAKWLQSLLPEGLVFRCEYLKSPKHNTLKYDRIPKAHLVLFDVTLPNGSYLEPRNKSEWADIMGIECVPLLGATWNLSKSESLEYIKSLMETESFLGGAKIEGVVCKRYPENTLYGVDGKPLMAKHVSEAFKEVHGKEWKQGNPSGKDFIGDLGDRYCADGRWAKAVQHLAEEGKLSRTYADIPLIIKEIQRDIKEECADEIANALMQYAMPKIERAAVRGAAEWYKQRLLDSQFES